MSKRLLLHSFYCLFFCFCHVIGFAQVARFTMSPTEGCAPLVVNFADQSSGTITSYNWNLGNSTTTTQQNPSTTYTSPGTYTVTLTVTGATGSDTKTETITVYDQPAVAFAANGATSGCAPHNVQFNSTITANSPGTAVYNWDFGDGTTGTGANPNHSYTTPGTYSVTLTVTNGAGCSRTVVQNAYITAYQVPVANFSVDQYLFCTAPATAIFTSSTSKGTTPYSINWDFGDGGTGTGSPTAHSYGFSGTFTVSLFISDARGCTDTVTYPSLVTVVGTLPSFTAPASVCELAPALLINTTPGHLGTTWDFGDGMSDFVNDTVQHGFRPDGTYTVLMTTTIGGCTKTLSKQIQVNPKPRATIGMNPSYPCPAPETVTFSGTSSHAASYAWKWNSGGTATGQTVSKLYTANIEDTLTLVTTSSFGCEDTAVLDTIKIRNIIQRIDIGPDIMESHAGCVPHTIYLSVAAMWAFPIPGLNGYLPWITSWSWDFGDGSAPSTNSGPMHTYVDTGDFFIRSIITTANGCRDTGYTMVHVDSPERQTFYATPPLAICPGEWIEFIQSTDTPLKGTTYKWTFNDTAARFQDTAFDKRDTGRVWNRFEHTGSYSVTLNTNHRGCKNQLTLFDYITVHPPDARFVDSVYCPPSTTVHFRNTSIGPTSQLWFFGDGDTSTAFSPTHTYAATNGYTVTLVVHNSVSGCSDTISKKILVADPVMNFSSDDSAVCKDAFVLFEGLFTGSNPRSYSWLVEGVQSAFDSTTNRFAHQFKNRGLFDVTMYVRSGKGCLDSFTRRGHVLVSQPMVNFGAYPPIGCKPLPVLFIDSTTNTPGVNPIEYHWMFGDGDTTTSNSSVNKIYPNSGRYTVRLVVTDSLLCIDSMTRVNYVSVHKPQARFTGDNNMVCKFQKVNFTSSSTGTSPLRHDWDFGDGTKDTGAKSSHFYSSTGIYSVRLIVTDSVGCTDTLIRSKYITVNAPNAAFSMSDTLAICPPVQVRFTNKSTLAQNYSWDFGTGGSSVVVTNPVNTYATPGLYNIVLIATDAFGCTDTATGLLRVLGYNGAFTYTPQNGCNPMIVNFTTPFSVPHITWDFGDGVTLTSSNTTATHTYTEARTYLPKIIFSDGVSCVSSSIGLDTIHVDQVTANFNWSVPCVGTAFTLKDSSYALFSSPAEWSWYFGGNDSAAGSSTSYTFHTSGNHSVTMVSMNGWGCRDTITKTVFINDLPVVDVTKDTAICPGDPVELFASGASKYTWNPNPDSMKNCPVCDIAFVHLSSMTPGDFAYFTVTGTDDNGCINRDSTKVIIQLKTTSSTGPGGEICVGESFRLHAEGAQKYEWIPTEFLDSPFIASPLTTPKRTMTYIVVAQEGTCLVDSQYVQVIVHSNPLFSAGNDETIALGSAVTLKPTKSGITRIEWVADTTLTCWDCFTPSAHPYYTRTYYATGYNEFGCATTDSVTVFVRCNGSLVFIPNSFTPNGDGKNDYFFPRGEGLERMSVIRVFNRWGEMMFERKNVSLNDELAGWDGTYNGKQLAPDVYVYWMQSICSTGEVLQWKGDVTLMR